MTDTLLKMGKFDINGVSLPAKALSKSRKYEYKISEKGKPLVVLSFHWPKHFSARRDLNELDVATENEARVYHDFDEFEEHFLDSNGAGFPEGRDTFGDGVHINLKLTFYKTELFGSLFSRKNLFLAARRHLFNSYGPGCRYSLNYDCILKKDRNNSLPFPFVEYTRRRRKGDKSRTVKDESHECYTGSCIAISPNHFLIIETSLTLKGANFSYQQSYEYLEGVANVILSNVELTFANEPEYHAFSINEDCALDWSAFTRLRHRYEIERDLINQGLVTQEDCLFNFSEEDLKSDLLVMIGGNETTSLLVDDLILSENFAQFTGKIRIPEAKYPNNPVEKYIKETMKNYTEALRAYYENDDQP